MPYSNVRIFALLSVILKRTQTVRIFFIFGKKKQPIDVKIIYTTRVTRARWHYTVVIKLYTKGDVSVGGGVVVAF